jgi:hypothetical protein
MADTPPVKWTRVPIPDQADAGRWVLASGSDVTHLAMAVDGTLYAAANPTATTQRLFKSTDNGTTWAPTGQVAGTIVDIATAPDDPSLVYYATSANVYKSNNAGATFASLPPNPGSAGTSNTTITSIAVTGPSNLRTVAVATTDTDPGQYGGVYTLDESQLIATWQNSNIGNYDVLAIAAPPNQAPTRQLVAVASNETDTVVIARLGSPGWGSAIGPAYIRNVAASGAVICFPSDYGVSPAALDVFVGLKTGTGTGDVYRADLIMGGPGQYVDLNAASALGVNNIDIATMCCSGNATTAFLAAGVAGSPNILVSNDGGTSWKKSIKGLTGTSVAGLVVAMDYAASRRVFAVTCGAESAFSRSDDGAVSWYQTGLIDTQTTSSGLIDLAVSPDQDSDGEIFILTWGGKHSLWRSRDSGTSWQRVFCSALPGVDTLGSLSISPKYGTSDKALFVAGTSGRSPSLWKSADGGETFSQRYVPYAIDAWAAADGDTLFVAGYDGANGLVSATFNGGFFFSQPVKVGNQPLKSVAVSPDFVADTTILLGNTVGKIYVSANNGTTFRQLGPALPLSGTGAGQVSVAFDPDFANSKRVFATTDAPSTTTSRERVFTLVVGESEVWEGVDNSFPIGGIANKVSPGPNGTLYVANSKAVAAAAPQGGVERALDANSSDATFETVTQGLNDGSTLRGLCVSGNQLWCLDTTNTRLMTFVDTLTQAPTLKSPSDGEGGVEINGTHLDWEGLSGATTYQWQLSDNGGFSDLPAGFDASPQSSACRPPLLQLATTYSWRVRVTRPIRSPWSAESTFITKLGNAVVAPQLLSPAPGAIGVPTDPVFQWTSLAEAEAYELLLGPDVTFTEPAAARTGHGALPETAWQSDVRLEYGTSYYWKVRAIGASSSSAWSNVGAFTVQSAPTPAAVTTPAAESQPVIQVTVPTPIFTNTPPPDPGPPSWLLYGVAAVGLVLIGLLAAILIILIKRQ